MLCRHMTSFRDFFLRLVTNAAESAVWLFFWLTISFAVFAWVGRSILYADPAPGQFGSLSAGSLGFVAVFGILLIVLDIYSAGTDA